MSARAGDTVEVKSAEEILATLDADGTLDGLPFMPEMLKFCGRRFRVRKTAHKTCDTVSQTGGRSMRDAVHLEDLRCDGGAHDGCQARCSLFWKEAWLRPAAGRAPKPNDDPAALAGAHDWLEPHTQAPRAAGEPARYRCQATLLLEATAPLPYWDVRQYVRDVTSGNTGAIEALRALSLGAFNALQRWRGGVPRPELAGRAVGRTPRATLDLQPGEMVRVKSREEIEQTLGADGKNRGLWFDREMLPYCGRSFRVMQRVERIIHERTREMIELPNDCVMLEGVVCQSRYSANRLNCPRAILSYWREIWLERVE